MKRNIRTKEVYTVTKDYWIVQFLKELYVGKKNCMQVKFYVKSKPKELGKKAHFQGTQNAVSCLKIVEFFIEDSGEVSSKKMSGF